MTIESSQPVAAVDPWARSDTWTSRLLLVLAVIEVIALLFVVPALPLAGTGPVVSILIAGSMVGLAGLFYATALAIARRRPWARGAATWLLVATLVAGLVDLVVGLTQARLTIPIGSIVAGYALTLRPGPLPPVEPWATRRARLVGATVIALMLVPGTLAFAATDERSPLVATRDDLQLDLTVTCEGAPMAMPTRIVATAEWTWLRRDALGSDPDTVGIGWLAPREDDQDAPLLILAEGSASAPEIAPGGYGESQGVVESLFEGLSSWTWSVNPAPDPMPDGWVTVVLEPGDPDHAARPGDGWLNLTTVYAHGARWHADANAGCRW